MIKRKMNKLSLVASAEQTGVRVDMFISENCDMTRSSVQKLIENSSVTVNGKAVAKN